METKNDLAADIFEPFDRLIEIEVARRTLSVPENNTILRCLQFVALDAISDAELCWNGDCLNCMVNIEESDTKRSVMACRTKAEPGLRVLDLSRELSLALSKIVDSGNAIIAD